jgi:hypothetical protein
LGVAEQVVFEVSEGNRDDLAAHILDALVPS